MWCWIETLHQWTNTAKRPRKFSRSVREGTFFRSIARPNTLRIPRARIRHPHAVLMHLDMHADAPPSLGPLPLLDNFWTWRLVQIQTRLYLVIGERLNASLSAVQMVSCCFQQPGPRSNHQCLSIVQVLMIDKAALLHTSRDSETQPTMTSRLSNNVDLRCAQHYGEAAIPISQEWE